MMNTEQQSRNQKKIPPRRHEEILCDSSRLRVFAVNRICVHLWFRSYFWLPPGTEDSLFRRTNAALARGVLFAPGTGIRGTQGEIDLCLLGKAFLSLAGQRG